MSDTTTAEPGTDIVALVEATPVLVLTDKQKFSDFYDAMRRECDAHEPDLTTEKGRKEIASLAYKVARTKTAIDDAGKKLNEEARAQINAIDEARRDIRKQLDDLKEEVRRPLTEWEKAKEQREAKAAEELRAIHEMGRVDIDDTTETVKSRIDELLALDIDHEVHAAGTEMAQKAKASALESLNSAHERLVREEAERAELERLREAEAERERQAEKQRAREEEERQRAEAEKAELERVAALQRETEERARREAEERARREAEEVARAEQERIAREHEEALAAERRRAEEAEKAAQEERDRIARAEAERQAAADREAAEQRKREADRTHRSKIMTAAKEAIIEAGPVEEPVAKSIVLAIAAGNVPNVSIRF
ncbi:MAG: hypothetical protein KDA43_10210 [Hyphomonas sp.]|nr:hypothetical protein [Hyphomonas sp.]